MAWPGQGGLSPGGPLADLPRNGQTMFKTPKSFQTANIMTTSSQCQSANDVLYVPNHKHPTVCIILGKTNLLPNKNKIGRTRVTNQTLWYFSQAIAYTYGDERGIQACIPSSRYQLGLGIMCMQPIPIPREIEKGQLELGQEKLLAPVFNQSIL